VRPASRSSTGLGDMTRRTLLDRYAPAAVLVNQKSEGLFFSGPVDRYLKVPAGEAGQNLLAMVGQDIRAALREVLRQAGSTREKALSDSLWIKDGGERRLVRITVEPLATDDEAHLLVTFEDFPDVSEPPVGSPEGTDTSIVAQMQKELEAARRELNLTIRDLQASNEELRAANEEAMSMNEEFQSTNEELETSKEELQSLNEELRTVNKQLEQKITEERIAIDDLNNLLNSSQIATIFLDKQLRIKRFTPTTKGLFSMIATDVGRPLLDIAQQFSDECLLEDCKRVVEDLDPATVEVVANDGRWFLRRVLPYRTLSNQIDGVVITFNDITKQKQSEAEALTARDFAESIVDTVRHPLIVLDRNLCVVAAGRSFYEVFDVEAEQIRQKSFYQIANGQWDVPEIRTALARVLDEQKPIDDLEILHDFAFWGRRALKVTVRLIPAKGDRQDLVLVAIEDLTEELQVEYELDERNARLDSILQSAQLGIVAIHKDGIIQSFSSAAETIFGYRADEVIGRNVKLLVPEPYHSEHDGYIQNYLKTGQAKIIGKGREVEGLAKDGSRIPLDLSISEAEFDHDRVFTAVVRDLAPEKIRQSELVHAQKMEAMGQLTGGVAHDFNNLLTVLSGSLELIESGKFKDRSAKFFEDAHEAIRLGGELTRGLLAFGRRLPLKPERINPNGLISQIVNILDRTLPENIQISTKLEKPAWKIEVDPAQLQNAILNLGLNARDAMPDGGKLIIETAKVTLDQDEASLHGGLPPGDYVAVMATDTGEGMSEEVRSRAFEPFFTTKDGDGGTGLGLSMIYGFTRQSGGHVQIFSDVGHGTTITLLFPRFLGPAERSKTPTTPKSVPNGDGETILVVEDNPGVLRVNCNRIESLGYRVLSAKNGPAAIDVLEAHPDIHLVFTDVSMPGGMSGIDLVEELKKRWPDIRILLTSGHAQEALNLGAGYELLRKPCDMATLAGAIRRHLS
jgi:two-component system, chemotaxis family, CheB/CheR fusion protein